MCPWIKPSNNSKQGNATVLVVSAINLRQCRFSPKDRCIPLYSHVFIWSLFVSLWFVLCLICSFSKASEVFSTSDSLKHQRKVLKC